MNRARLVAVCMPVFILVSLCWGLGSRGLNEPDEGRVAGIGAEMYRAHEYLVPRFYDRVHMNKPPLVYWLLMASYALLGIHETAARLPAVLAAAGILLLTWDMARRLFNDETARRSVLILLSTPLFFAMSRLIDYNMVLSFWVTLALWACLRWEQDGKSIFMAVFYLSLALSFLTKGPVGMAIVLIAMAGYRMTNRTEEKARALWSWPWVLACITISLSWFLVVLGRFPELWTFFTKDELVDRVFSNKHERDQVFLYFFYIIPVLFLPWLPALLAAIMAAVSSWRKDDSIRFLAAWAFLPIIMFSISVSKLPTYILPLFPPMAMLAAKVLDHERLARIQSSWLLGMIVIIPLGIYLYGVVSHDWVLPAGLSLALWVLIIVLAVIAFSCRSRKDCLPLFAALLILSYLCINAALTRNEVNIAAKSTTRGVGLAVQRLARENDRVVLIDRHPRGLSFYVDKPISIPLYKFEVQVKSDEERLRDRGFTVPAEAFAWFDSTQRTFLITSQKVYTQLLAKAVNKPVEIYRDPRFLLLCNQDPGQQ